MKRQKLLVCMLLSASVLLFTACGLAGNTNNTPLQEGAVGPEPAEQETAEEKTEITEDNTTAEDITATEDNEEAAASETVQFIVDITDNLAAGSKQVVGNTAAYEGYCGIIELNLDDNLAKRAESEIQPGKTYVFTVKPMMTMSIPPQMPAIDFAPASEEDIRELEEIRKTISNYDECMESYETMPLAEIIQDANQNYALWTQEEITEYVEFITEKGYTDDAGVKSYVKIRAELDGSIISESENGMD